MLTRHFCSKCGKDYVPSSSVSAYCYTCVLTNLGELELRPLPSKLKTPDNTERDELAKEIFKLLTVDLAKAAMENPIAAANFRNIMEANCRTAFLHADTYMEQKSKCQNKSQSN